MIGSRVSDSSRHMGSYEQIASIEPEVRLNKSLGQ